MDKEIIISEIIKLIEEGYYDFAIEDYLKRKGIDPNEFNDLKEISKSRIYEKKLKTVPLKNKLVYAFFIIITIVIFMFFYSYLPIKIESESESFISIIGAILTSICFSFAFFFHGSWKKENVEENYFQRINFSGLAVLAFLPCLILYFIISNKFD